MAYFYTLDTSVIAFIILGIIYFSAYNRFSKAFMQYRLFIAMVLSNMALIIIDILGWAFNGLPGSINLSCNIGFNLLLYLTVPIAPMVSVVYIDYQVFHTLKRTKTVIKVLAVLLAFNAVLSLDSLTKGWFFSVDSQNMYHRGEYFWVHLLVVYSVLAYAFFIVLFNRKRIDPKYYYTLMLFFIPCFAGSLIQIFHYGVSYNWMGMTLSILIIYFNIQDRSLSTDYLTGVYNRLQLDNYMNHKIRTASGNKSFSAILVDLNHFKQINDQFGHSVGDEALQQAARIIKKSFRQHDFVGRYGGDEFLIIMDMDDREQLNAAVERLKRNFETSHADNDKRYKLSFSIGYDVYDPSVKMSANDFFKHIDLLMYKHKSELRTIRSPEESPGNT